MRSKRLAVYAWVVVGYTILVILWGAYVRATGSGAGCGSHWPLCDGVVIPQAETTEQAIEFSHRVSSSLNGLLVIGLLIGASRVYGKGSAVLKGAVASFIFIIIEGLLGAVLVRFELVAGNTSGARAIMVGLHLANTFLLLGTLTLTAWWTSGGSLIRWRRQPAAYQWLLGIGIIAMLILGATGAVTALGDTLFPPQSFLEEIRADFDPYSNFLIRLRIWHPILAIIVGAYLWLAARYLAGKRPSPAIIRFSRLLLLLFGLQLAAGLLNIMLRVPVFMQMLHLLLADLVWIVFVLMSASVLAVEADEEEIERTAAPLPQGTT